MKKFETKDIRNVVLVGHGGAGKTSLAEAFLFDAKAVTRLGQAGTDTSSFDYEPEEIKRQGTIQTSVGFVEWQKRKINFIDTPGDQNFLVDTHVSMQVAGDAIVLVVSCPDGVQVGTEKVWQYADELSLPRVIFVNKMDRERADWDTCVADIKKSLSEKATPLHMPIGKEHGFEGVVDLLTLKAQRFAEDGRAVKAEDVPANLKADAQKAREKLVEDIASSDDALLEKYLGTGELAEDEIIRGLGKAISAGTLIPILAGSAGKNVGIQPLLDFIANAFPSPADRPPVKGTDPKGNAVERPAREDAPFAARVFKTIGADIGMVSLARIVSGKLTSDSNVFNSTRDTTERSGSLYVLIGKKRDTQPEAAAGDIVGLAKLKSTKTGDVLCDDKNPVTLAPLELPQPVIRYAIHAKSKGDEDKLGAKLHDLTTRRTAPCRPRSPTSRRSRGAPRTSRASTRSRPAARGSTACATSTWRRCRAGQASSSTTRSSAARSRASSSRRWRRASRTA
jgi:elongation factor G